MIDVIRGIVPISSYVMQIAALLASLCFHEYAHAKMALRLGDGTAMQMGRLSLNPFRHLDPLGTLLIVMGAPVGWAKPVPVNPVNFRRDVSIKKGFALVSAAGPLMNLFLSLCASIIYNGLRIVYTLLMIQGRSGFLMSFLYTLMSFFDIFFIINIFLAIFNLLPFPPLDGAKIYSAFLPDRAYAWLLSNERYFMLALIMIFLFSPITGRVLRVLASPFIWIIGYPVSAIADLIIKAVVL